MTKSALALITHQTRVRDISGNACALAINKLIHKPTEHQITVSGTWKTSSCTV